MSSAAAQASSAAAAPYNIVCYTEQNTLGRRPTVHWLKALFTGSAMKVPRQA